MGARGRFESRLIPNYIACKLLAAQEQRKTSINLTMKNLFTVVVAGSQYLLHPQKLVRGDASIASCESPIRANIEQLSGHD